MTRALVTGANGHVGANLTRELVRRGYDVVPFVRRGSDLRSLRGLKLEHRIGDVMDAASLVDAARNCELIFHTAAVYSLSTKSLSEVLEPAMKGVENVFLAAKSVGARRVVYTSSIAAVGYSRSPSAVRNETSWNDDPKNPYFQAKVDSERRAHRLSEETGVPIVVVCPALVLGPFDYRSTPSTEYVRALLAGTGATYEGGCNVVHVGDVAAGHVNAAERGTAGERYILGGDNCSLRELGAHVGAITGVTPRHVPWPRLAFLAAAKADEARERLTGRPPQTIRSVVEETVERYASFDCSKARAELGFRARGVAETLADAARWLAFAGLLAPPLTQRIAARFPADPSW